MRHSFCPDSKTWETKRDEVVTVSEVLTSCTFGDRIKSVKVVGSQKDDYCGASMLFGVSMEPRLVIKFFGNCRVFSATLCPCDGIRVKDRDHLIEWAKENDISDMDKLREKYPEYDRRFPSKRIWGPDGYLRISVD